MYLDIVYMHLQSPLESLDKAGKGALTLIISVLINLVLLCVIARGVKNRVVQHDYVVNSLQPDSERFSNQLGGQTEEHQEETPVRDWSDIWSDDYRIYISRLRAFHAPEQAIRDLIMAELDRLYSRRLATSTISGDRRMYWEIAEPPTSRSLALQSSLLDEKYALIKELLGIDIAETNRQSAVSCSFGAMEYLSARKRDTLQSVLGNYAEAKRRLNASFKGVMTSNDFVKLKVLEQQKDTDVESLLTPEEHFEYAVRTSPTAHDLQRDLEGFHPNETEFRAIFQARLILDSKLKQSTNSDGIVDVSTEEPQKEFDGQVKSVLGEQRYDEYRRALDPDFKSLVRIVDRFELPQDTAVQILQLKQNAEVQRNAIVGDPGLDAGQRSVELQVLHDQVNDVLGKSLGEQGSRAYLDIGGRWIDNLVERQ